MGWWKEYRERKAKKKREKWEEEQLPRGELLATKSSIEQIVKAFNEMELEVKRLHGKIEVLEKAMHKKEIWKVNQDKDGGTEWIKHVSISYVSKVYTTGPKNAYYFDAIIDGQKIVFDADTKEEAETKKLELLDVERVETFNAEEQAERFPVETFSEEVSRKNSQEKIVNDVLKGKENKDL